MRISLISVLFLAFSVIIGCGGTAVQSARNAVEKAEQQTADAADELKNKNAEVKESAENTKKEAVRAAEESVPALPEILLVKVTLINRMALEGIIIKGDKKAVTIQTEIGAVTLQKNRILSITPASLPEAF